MTDKELLLAISDTISAQIEPLKKILQKYRRILRKYKQIL